MLLLYDKAGPALLGLHADNSTSVFVAKAHRTMSSVSQSIRKDELDMVVGKSNSKGSQ